MLLFLTNMMLFIFGAFGVLLISGYILYKADDRLKTVDDGIRQFWKILKKVGSAVFWFCMGELGHPNPEKLVNQNLYLTSDELNDLKHLLGEKIFELPVLEDYSQNNGCLFIRFSAVSVKEKYRDIEHEQLVRLIEHTVQSFYQDIRKQKPLIRVQIATPKYCNFAIPLSSQGLKYLDKQDELQDTFTDFPDSEVEPLEEEFQIFDEDEGEE